jgi:regulator of sirC expression with transglutaminase-like and TPR domain
LSGSSHWDEFVRVAGLKEDEIDLGYAAFLIAACEYHDLDVPGYLRRLDMLSAGVAERMPASADPLEQVGVINEFLFRQRHFRGNSENYYDPRNSYLSDVLERRLGIPISLSVLYAEVAKRLRLPIRGVGLPGHFVVRYVAEGVDLFVDPFNGGRLLASEDCHEMVMRALERQHPVSFGHFLEPIGTCAILIRMLTNLKIIYIHQSDFERVIRTLNQIILVNPKATDEYRERGLVHLAGRRYRAALVDLTTYLERCPDAPDADLIHHRIDMICATLGTSFE